MSTTTIEESFQLIAEAMTRIEAFMVTPDYLATISVLSTAVAAIAAAAATVFAWRSIKQQIEIARRQYIQQKRAEYYNKDMPQVIQKMGNWVSKNEKLLEKLEKEWPDYTINEEERNELESINPCSFMIFHYFKDIYINYKSGFIKKKDVAEFKKFKTYSLLIGPEKIISQQIFKDFPGGEPSDEVNVLHEWIDELAKA